jgi:hypothetical protein
MCISFLLFLEKQTVVRRSADTMIEDSSNLYFVIHPDETPAKRNAAVAMKLNFSKMFFSQSH